MAEQDGTGVTVKNIEVNGVTYEMEHETYGIFGRDTILIWDMDEDLVSNVSINHQTKTARIEYKIDPTDVVEGEINYSDFDPKNPEATAIWSITSHPGKTK